MILAFVSTVRAIIKTAHATSVTDSRAAVESRTVDMMIGAASIASSKVTNNALVSRTVIPCGRIWTCGSVVLFWVTL